MLSKAVLKYINSLQIKKYRHQHQAFVVEGAKSVMELLKADFELQHLFVTEAFYHENTKTLAKGYRYHIVTEEELTKAGTFASNNAALAVAKMRTVPPIQLKNTDFIIALDDVRDPGNLGTIIRIADWYGISQLVCSENCADFYNPKVISATMGSFTRVQAQYLDLVEWLKEQKKVGLAVYGASLAGENLHKQQLQPQGIVVLGNEANGIRPEVEACMTHLIKIPAFGKAESLNVATATAIIIDNFKRNS
ncbi:RNA methyltransferase [Pontibacter sp. 13R65]|uniref:TrmH family RNA methyltransferase n=1 Tax=Pontibacter sp. 13R65 TaxID=3127458 RepID=UPI00301D5F32